MSYKTYRKFLFALLVAILGITGGVYISYKKDLDKSSVVSLYDLKTVAVSEQSESAEISSPNKESRAKMIVPCGDPIGIYVKSSGVMVIALGEVKDKNGNSVSPCAKSLVAGDYITAIEGEKVNDKKRLIELVKECDGKSIRLDVNRNGNTISVDVLPANTDKGYMLGLWVKDDISGIGTLTYVDETGFGALGHSINDNDTGKLFKVSDGALYMARLVNIVKPKDGKPGKLEGVIDYSASNIIGRIDDNTEYGVSGYLTKYGANNIDTSEWLPVARESEISLGNAYILSSISGNREYYKVNIVDIDLSNESLKNLEIKVTDERLLDTTGGIVQGLSGTPIIQNGRVIGAITHVFVNDSTKGYGIYIGKMLGDKLKEKS